MVLRGIDVSHWQGRIDWPKVANDGVTFAMCKATEAAARVDPRWQANRAGATAAGVPVGAYHFARPGRVSAADSARHHLRHAHPADGEIVSALDLEDTDLSARDTTRWALEWLAIVEEATAAVPIVYTGPGFTATHLHPDPALGRYPLWVAHYTTRAQPRLPKPWTSWLWWQHTDKGTVAGISGGVDTNRFTAPPPLVGATPTPEPGGFLMALSDDEQRELLEKVRATDLRVTELQREVVGEVDDQGQSRQDRFAKRIDEALRLLGKGKG